MSTSNMPTDSPAPSPGYEFTARQNTIIAQLAAAMRWVGVPLTIIGVFYVLATVAHLFRGFVHPSEILIAALLALAAAFYLALGIWTTRAADEFRLVTTTSGADITHLMSALDSLRKKYSLLSLIIKIYVALVIVALIAGLIGLLSGAFSR